MNAAFMFLVVWIISHCFQCTVLMKSSFETGSVTDSLRL